MTGATTWAFQREIQDWLSSEGSLSRIYALNDGAWGRSCDDVLFNLGYRYTLEHWLRGMLLQSPYKVHDVTVADYVYLPHCACGIFMHLAAGDIIDHEAGLQRGHARMPPRRKNMTKPSGEIDYLLYEGRLPPRAVARTDRGYLMNQVTKWEQSSAYQHCQRRASCRFLIVSIYGRHVF